MSSHEVCNVELEIMPHKFKCQKMKGHRLHHLFKKENWDEVDIMILRSKTK